jgi:hypothetical protein
MATTKIIPEVIDLNAASSTGGLKMPSGGAFSGTATEGMMRNDTSQSSETSASTMQFYNGTEWKNFVNTPGFATANFAPVTYTGNRPSTQSITGVGFAPDLIWIKNRDSSSFPHVLTDSVRGNTKYVQSNLTDAELTATNGITSFDSDGFSLGDNGYFNGGLSGDNNEMVAWCWKGGGSAVSNTDGSVTSQVSANPDAGFSIATYTGVGYPNSTTGTVGHGLTSIPELVIIKKRDSASPGNGSWVVGTEYAGSGWDGSFYLNSSGAYSNSINYFWNGDPTDSVVKLKNDWFVNGNNRTYVMYSFHSVPGYQKVGSYSGTGVNGNSITTGFEPRWLLVKRTNAADNWVIVDTARGLDGSLFPDLSSQELSNSNVVSFNSSGFTVNGASGGWNNGTSTYLYLAIA